MSFPTNHPPRVRPGGRIPRRGALALLAGVPAALATACTKKAESPASGPSRTSAGSSTPTPTPTPQVTVQGLTGGLADLSDLKKGLGKDWTESINKSSVFDGKQYAAPWFAVNRTVIYNKKIWADAGIKGTPKTRDEFFDALDKIGKKTDAEPLYMPGQNWYFFDGLLIANDVDLVKKKGGKWVSNLSDPKVVEAMEVYKKYASYSKAPKDKD